MSFNDPKPDSVLIDAFLGEFENSKMMPNLHMQISMQIKADFEKN